MPVPRSFAGKFSKAAACYCSSHAVGLPGLMYSWSHIFLVSYISIAFTLCLGLCGVIIGVRFGVVSLQI